MFGLMFKKNCDCDGAHLEYTELLAEYNHVEHLRSSLARQLVRYEKNINKLLRSIKDSKRDIKELDQNAHEEINRLKQEIKGMR